MKASELKSEIKDYIYEILSGVDEVTMVGPDTEISDIPFIAKTEKTNPSTVKAALDQAKKTKQPVGVAESEDEDREPTKAELDKEKVQEAIKKIKMMKEGDDKKQKITTLKNIISKLKK